MQHCLGSARWPSCVSELLRGALQGCVYGCADGCCWHVTAVQVAVTLPDVKGRQQIIDLYLKGKPVTADVDTGELWGREGIE